jgi:hypothetical protein
MFMERTTPRKRAPRPGEGRPTIYKKELVEKILNRIASGESVRSIASTSDMPNASTIHAWVLENDEFSKKYAVAKQIGAEIDAEKIEEIARNENIDVNRAKLIIDTMKWNLAKKLPGRFGDKMDVTSDGRAIKGNSIIVADFSNEADSQ